MASSVRTKISTGSSVLTLGIDREEEEEEEGKALERDISGTRDSRLLPVTIHIGNQIVIYK